jgi:uncharacterized protein
MTALLDAAIFMYAAGATHPLKEHCAALLARVADRSLDATTSAEVVQEVLHRYRAIGRGDGGIALAREILSAFQPVVSITDGVARRLPDLAARYPGLSSRDIIHAATCIEHGIQTIITPDRGFDAVSEIKRLDPIAAAA